MVVNEDDESFNLTLSIPHETRAKIRLGNNRIAKAVILDSSKHSVLSTNENYKTYLFQQFHKSQLTLRE